MRRLATWSAALLICLVVAVLVRIGYHRYHTAEDPQILETEHFSLHFQDVSRIKVQDVAEGLEKQYSQTIPRLRAPVHPRLTVFVHPDQSSLTEALGFAAAGGIRGIDTLHVAMLPFPLSLVYPLRETAVHEFVHTVTLNILLQSALERGQIASVEEFDRLYGEETGKRFDQVYPRWLWESVALYEAGQHSAFTLNMSIKDGFPTLEQLNGPHNQVYHVGYSLADFIVQTWGWERLRDLIVRDGDTSAALGVSEREFETRWEAFVRENYRVVISG